MYYWDKNIYWTQSKSVLTNMFSLSVVPPPLSGLPCPSAPPPTPPTHGPHAAADGARAVHHGHGRHRHREAGEPAGLQNRHLRLEKALPLLVCSSFTHRLPCELRSHGLDS